MRTQHENLFYWISVSIIIYDIFIFLMIQVFFLLKNMETNYPLPLFLVAECSEYDVFNILHKANFK